MSPTDPTTTAASQDAPQEEAVQTPADTVPEPPTEASVEPDATSEDAAPPPEAPKAKPPAKSNDPKARLVAEITCPNCWHRFAPEQTLFIARHDDLIGDPIAGEAAYRRFLPSRFNAAGDAIDARGMACQQLACPHCHLEVARPFVEMHPHFSSIVGVPASGKSYFLATMTWELRRLLPSFGLTLSDADPAANQELQRAEETLFMNHEPHRPVSLRKTEIQGDALYQTIFLEGQRQSFPRPFQFAVAPVRAEDHLPDTFPYRCLVLYDNAGEHFLPGADSTNTPVTLHLAESSEIFFMFDPTQDPRFRKHCYAEDPQLTVGSRPDEAAGTSMTNRQEVILNEMAARVRRYKAIGQTQKHDRPLVMILAKADVWIREAGFDQEPIHPADPSTGEPAALNAEVIQTVSDNCRKLMLETCPEIVAAAEGFSQRVVYIPASSLGTSPELVEEHGHRFLGVRPEAIHPKWVTVPLLWALSQTVKGLIPIR